MNHDHDKHHRRSIRLRGYDYSEAGAYFVTICTQGRECLFGDIVDEEIRLNNAGRVVSDTWHKIPGHFPNTDIDTFIVMPNHVHGIIVIVGAQFIAPIETIAPVDRDITNQNKNQGWDPYQGVMNHAPTTVGKIVRTFKARCTHAINQIHNTPGHPVWQRNYYEHIIRSEDRMNVIREYIINNPVKWAEDEDNPLNIANLMEKSGQTGRGRVCKKFHRQGAQKMRNETYLLGTSQ